MVDVLSGAVELASFGFYPVRLHYPIFNETGDGSVRCSCERPDCSGSAGKHPVEKSWGTDLTVDPDKLQRRFSVGNGVAWNIGIVIGPAFGIPHDQAIIDVEDDSPEGRELADVLLAGYEGPAYTSGKSIHRLYRWTEDLPDVANLKSGGLEFRFGGVDKQTQSVAPPSMHQNGSQYRWLEGRHPNEKTLQPLPLHVIEWLKEQHVATGKTSGGGERGANESGKFRKPSGTIVTPGRHHALLTYGNSLWRRACSHHGINGLEEQDVIDEVWMQLAGANLLVCSPPKTDYEVLVIFNSTHQFMLKELHREADEKLRLARGEKKSEETNQETNGEDDAPESERTLHQWLRDRRIRLVPDPSLNSEQDSPNRIDEWVAEWSVEFVSKSDSDLVLLTITGHDEPVTMSRAEFAKPESMAGKVMVETAGKVNLDRTFTFWDWKSIWLGRRNDAKNKKGITRGLKEFLVSRAKVQHAGEHQISLADQVEDLVLALAGTNRATITEAVLQADGHGMETHERLKLDPRGGGLIQLRAPEDPLTGWYRVDDHIVLMVKIDELTRRYRSSYGAGVANRLLAEAMLEHGFVREKMRGRFEGRWFVKRNFE